jgi:dTDP-4-dehydrorhamnose 3,5-epimerase-like enzyme
MEKFKFFTLKSFKDERGSLVPIELKDYIDWEAKRVYYSYANQKDRGGHAHRIEKEFFICQQGSFIAKLHDGLKWHEQKLNPNQAVFVNNMVWHEFTGFTKDAILLAISSTNYDPNDYIRDFNQFLTEL